MLKLLNSSHWLLVKTYFLNPGQLSPLVKNPHCVNWYLGTFRKVKSEVFPTIAYYGLFVTVKTYHINPSVFWFTDLLHKVTVDSCAHPEAPGPH